MKDMPAADPNRSPRLSRLRYGVVWLMLSMAVLAACERRAARPILDLHAGSGPNSFSFSVGESVLFGLGPFMAQGGEIRIESAQVKGMKGAELQTLVFENPAENSGREPGIEEAEPMPFRTRTPEGLVIRPGERWFAVVVATAKLRGTHSAGDLLLRFRSGDRTESRAFPLRMTFNVSD